MGKKGKWRLACLLTVAMAFTSIDGVALVQASEGETVPSVSSAVSPALVSGSAITTHTHSLDDWTVEEGNEATCEKTGLKVQRCKTCKEIVNTEEIPALGHNYGEYVQTKEATVLTAGQETRTCSRCGHEESRDTEKLNGTISVTASSLTMKTGQSTTAFKVTGMAAGDSLVSAVSANTAIVKVSNVKADGTLKLTAQKKAGKTTLTLTLASGTSKTVTVSVQKAKVKTTSITVSQKTVTLQQGKSVKITATLNPVTSQDKISWKSSNKKVATVTSKGVIKGVKAGTAKITVRAGSKKTVITVKVQGVKTTSLSGVPASKTLKKGKRFSLKVKTVPSNSSDKITYSSSNKKVATVTAKGKIKAKSAGTTVITVKSGSVVKKFTLTVTK